MTREERQRFTGAPMPELTPAILAVYTELQHIKVSIGNWKLQAPGCSIALDDLAARLDVAIAKTGVER